MRCKKENFIEGGIYHFYNRAVDGENLFRQPSDYLFILNILRPLQIKFNFSIFTYCLMPNHFHFLFRQDNQIPLFHVFNNLFSRYVQRFNHQYHRRGCLFQGKLQHKPITDEKYLLAVCQYIHFNPIKAGLVRELDDWPYSNYLEWIGKRHGVLFCPEIRDTYFPVPSDYAAQIEEYRKYSEKSDFIDLLHDF